jgi:hypothetical protein
MPRSKAFSATRDGQIRVKLNDAAREFLEVVVEAIIAAETDHEHEWHATLHRPITPELDADDPLRVFERQQILESNAAMMKASLRNASISTAEAWAWLATMQLALRARTAEAGVNTEDDLKKASPQELETIHALQYFLFELTTALL